MKRHFSFLLVVSMVFAASVALAAIATTPHDFTAAGPGVELTGATVCGTCHIPHGGDTTVTGAPIWARTLPGAGTFTVYGNTGTAGSSFTVSNTTVNSPGVFSLTCLSCHDGALGINTITKNGISSSYAVVAATTHVNATGYIIFAPDANGYSPYIGKNLQNDHPVGIEYRAPADVPLAGLVAQANAGYAAANLPLFGDRVECASCHDPHDNSRTKFLRVVPANICTDCHGAK